MATLRQGKEARTVSDILLEGMITAEVQNVLQDEIPKLAEQLAKSLYEKIRKLVTMVDTKEWSSSDEGDSSAKRGKIYHLTEVEEDIRETLKKRSRCYRCGKEDHDSGDCIYGRLMCY